MSKNNLQYCKSPNSSANADNDLSLTPHELNDLAIRIGADFGLPDINDINVGEESVNNDILVNVDQSTEDKGHNDPNTSEMDMETIVIETINEVDMSDAIVFDNVGNEVSISSSSSFDKQTSNTASFVTKPQQRRPRTVGPAKIRAPLPQQITHTPPSQTIRFPTQLVASQPQVIPISSFGTQFVQTAGLKGQTKAKVVKKGLTVSTSIQSIPTSDSSTLKVIYTSQGQQIVFSPSKQSAQLSSNPTVVSLQPSTSVAPPGKVLLRPVGSKTLSAISSSQPQQVIILSPVKANTTGVTSIAPVNKVFPIKSQPVMATKSPQRVLAPAPNQTKIAISKSLSDSKPVQLIRVVPLSSVQTPQQFSSTATFSTSKLVPLRPIAPNTSVRAIAPIPQLNQKIIVPTGGSKSNISSLSTAATSTSNTTFLTTTGPSNSGQVFMLQNPSLLKITPTTTTSSALSTKSVSFAATNSQRTNFVPIAPSPMTTASSASTLTAAQLSSLKITNGSTKAEDPHQKKPCNCTKSQCLKLYCDCFANGEFCSSCNCISCHNNLDHEEERQKAIRQCLERNPHAFHPKIGKGRAGDTERRHTKGCNCRRSGCLKNYCECYEAKILCSGLCKCVGCKNFEESFERKTLMHLADAAEVRSAQQTVATKNRLWGSDFKPKLPIRVDGDSFITSEVVDLTCQCLLAQAEQGEKNGLDYNHIESIVLEEFGRVLTQIIDCAAKNRNSKIKTELM